MTTTGLIEKKTNGASLAQMDGETLSKLVLNGDLSGLTQDQKTAYYVYRCKAAGLDPATKPFDYMKLQGKEVLYAGKECAAQISQRDKLSVTIIEAKPIAGDIYQVQARVSDSTHRQTDDLGCVNVKGLSGDALCNAMMKATTKAKRRAILAHAGLGMTDESEIETIPQGAKEQPTSHAQTSTMKTTEKDGHKHYTMPGDDAEKVPASVTDAAAPAGEPLVVPDESADMRKAVIIATSKGRSKNNTYGILVNTKQHDAGCQINAQTKSPCSCGADVWWNTFHDTPWQLAKTMKGKTGLFTMKTNDKGFTNIEHLAEVQG